KPGQKNLQFGVVSCNNYEAGFFAAFRRLSEKPDLNAVIHLGDYIYEYYRPKVRKRKLKNRRHDPPHELLVLSDYRQRYAQYRTDPDLQELHRLYPFITIWDDHEAANNSHAEGASAHNEAKEGDWQQRLETAKRVYFEWMPIRDHPRQYIYRKISYGNLADLMMLDTRYEGRDPQIYDMLDSAIFAPDRSMLGTKQKDWLLNALKESKAKWKLIGNQVIFSPLYAEHLHKRMENAFLDIWDGYPAERLQITQFIKNNDIENVVILTGDFHTSLAMEVPLDDWNHPQVPLGYNPRTGENAVAIEFATPSITSNNFDDFAKLIKPIRWLGLGRVMGKLIQRSLMKDEKRDASLPGGKRWINPHIKYGNFIDHGYFILTVGEDKVQADFYHIKNRYKKDSPEKKTKSLFSGDGENHLQVIKD
ncbi:MAG: alkaline phosphatase D family protein, partial [Bacteroidetes bacterium]|nr:alkaline phosphatase D family protein [Bacteroidota bacterium]